MSPPRCSATTPTASPTAPGWCSAAAISAHTIAARDVRAAASASKPSMREYGAAGLVRDQPIGARTASCSGFGDPAQQPSLPARANASGTAADHRRDLGLRPRPRPDGRPRVGRGLRRQLPHDAGRGMLRARLLPRRVRGRRDRVQPVSDRAVARRVALRRGAGVPVADVPPFGGLYPDRSRHLRPGRSARQAHRRARISDVGGDVVSRLPAGRVRHRRKGHQLGAGRPRESGPPREVSAQPAARLSACVRARRPDAVGDAGRRRARRRDGGAAAVVLRLRPSTGGAAVSGLPRGRARLLPQDRHLPDHACARRAPRRARQASLARRQPLQGVHAGQAARRRRVRRNHGAEDRAALGQRRVRRNARADGRRLLVLRAERAEPQDARPPWRAIHSNRASRYDCCRSTRCSPRAPSAGTRGSRRNSCRSN